MHGNLKMKLSALIRKEYVTEFMTDEDIGQILASLGTKGYEETSHEEY